RPHESASQVAATTRAPGTVTRWRVGRLGARRYNNSIAVKMKIAAGIHCRYGQALSNTDCAGTARDSKAFKAGPANVSVTPNSSRTPTPKVRPKARTLLVQKRRGVRTSYTRSRPAMTPFIPFELSQRRTIIPNESNPAR